MRVIPRRSKGRRQDEDPARIESPRDPSGTSETTETPAPPPPPESPSTPDPGLKWPPKPTIEPPLSEPSPPDEPSPRDAEERKRDTGRDKEQDRERDKERDGECDADPADTDPADADPAVALGQDSLRAGTSRGPEATTAVLPAITDPEAARRRARAAERQRAAAEVKRSRAARRQGLPYREPTPAGRAADQHRSALLVMVLTLGLLIAAVAVTGAMLASSMRTQPVKLASPLHIYPVTQTTPGQCPTGTQGITGQSGSGPTCYRMAQGIAIHKVADLSVQESRVKPGGYDVAVTLRSVDRDAFADLTRATVGRDLAFVVKNRIVTLPRVDMAILDGKVVVTGPPDRASANRLVRELKGR